MSKPKLTEITSWSKGQPDGSYVIIKKGSLISVGGSTKEYIILEDVVVARAAPDPIDTARDPYG